MSRAAAGTADAAESARKRRLVLLVGPDSEGRRDLARALIEGGHSTVICSGPPGCVLLREDRCVLVDAADVTVIMPSHSSRREVTSALALCAREARNAVIVEPSLIEQTPPGAEIVPSAKTKVVLEAVERALERGRGSARKGVADVADIWL
ncbi:MAG: hypothetical protein WEB06_10950 [Actinomycetota bacterium]